jgi:hypothetical protein
MGRQVLPIPIFLGFQCANPDISQHLLGWAKGGAEGLPIAIDAAVVFVGGIAGAE